MNKDYMVVFEKTDIKPCTYVQIGFSPYKNDDTWPFDTEIIDVACLSVDKRHAYKIAGDFVSNGWAKEATIWWAPGAFKKGKVCKLETIKAHE